LLTIPQLLNEMIATGRWPKSDSEALRQNLEPLVSKEFLGRLSPAQHGLYLFAPPFLTVRERSIHEEFWQWPEADPTGIDFDLTLDIGDFGLGSDSPILLDFSSDMNRPTVIYLLWSSDGSPNRWVQLSESFDRFVKDFKL